jgi:hypothetical protein
VLFNLSAYVETITLTSLGGAILTSFRVTGFSIRTRCVSLGSVPRASRSASSAKLFDVRTSVVRFGIDCAMVGWIWATRLRARRSVERRGERGKLPRSWMSLSVKSIASCGYQLVSL